MRRHPHFETNVLFRQRPADDKNSLEAEGPRLPAP